MSWPLTRNYEFPIDGVMVNEIDVKALRASLGISQTKFAELLGVDQSTVSAWETKGVPKYGAARKLLASFALYGRAVFDKGRAA